LGDVIARRQTDAFVVCHRMWVTRGERILDRCAGMSVEVCRRAWVLGRGGERILRLCGGRESGYVDARGCSDAGDNCLLTLPNGEAWTVTGRQKRGGKRLLSPCVRGGVRSWRRLRLPVRYGRAGLWLLHIIWC